MEIADIEQLARWLEEAGLDSIEIQRPEFGLRLTLHRNPVAARATARPADADMPVQDEAAAIVTARGAGLFEDRHPAREKPFVRVGDSVRAGDILAVIRAGPVYAPVPAPRDGRIEQIFPEAGALVGFGSPLFRLR